MGKITLDRASPHKENRDESVFYSKLAGKISDLILVWLPRACKGAPVYTPLLTGYSGTLHNPDINKTIKSI